MTRNRIVGLIGVVLGAAILIHKLSGNASGPSGNSAYDAGQMGGLVFAGLFVVVGAYYLVKG